MTEKPVVEKRIYTRLMDAYRRRPVYVPFANKLIRTTLIAKAKLEVRDVSNRGAAESDVIRDWYGNHRFFFGFAVLRSGTTFLARFLNQVAENDIIQHEPNINDYYYQALAIQSETDAADYIEKYRLWEIYYRLQGYSFGTYGEINPHLRRHSAALVRSLPEAKTFHLVRDGKGVLRSLMSREIFAFNDPMGKLIRPAAHDPYHSRWKSMTRFEKLCWLWQEDNRFLRETIGHTVQFEKLLSSYDYFCSELLEHIGLTVEREDWAAHTAQVNNQTPVYRMPSYESWESADREAFERICGDEMVANGYSV
jgi:hypothetical protein